MVFNSSILVAKPTNENTINTISELAKTSGDSSYIYNLLEFNDSIHDIDVLNKISYYRTLKENANNELANIDESVIGTVVERLSKIIESILNFIKNVIRKIASLSVFGKARYKNYSRMDIKDAKGFWARNPNEDRTVNIYYYPNIDNIDSQKFRASLNNIISELERVCDNKANTEKASDKSKEMAYKTLAKMIDKYVIVDTNDGILDVFDKKDYLNNTMDPSKVSSAATFNQFVKSNMCVVHQKACNMYQWHKYFLQLGNNMHNMSAYTKRVSEFAHDLERAKKIVANAVINTDEQKKHANDLVSQISAITTSYASFIYTIAKYEQMSFDYHTKIYERHVMRNINVDINESGDIHGEPFNSDTLFDNEDIRDFSRTEWLDLNLTTECYEAKFEMMETSKRIALQEAIIMTDDMPNKFERLIAMREAEEKKLTDKISGTIERIRQLLNKFIETIKNKSTEMVQNLKTNATFIAKPITLKEVKSKGDILAGMYRVQQKVTIIPYNYESMKNDLKDKETFFRNKILPGMRNTSQYAKRKLNWTEGMSVTDYCKLFYGASLPEDKYPKCVFATQDIEVNKENIVKFLNNPNNAFSCKNDLDVLENESKKVARSAANRNNMKDDSQNNQQSDTAQNRPDIAQESVYYSELYSRWFTEAEIEMGKQPEVSQTNNENNEEANAYRVYMDCYKDIILSKMTAAEFIYAELSQIVNAHMNSYKPKKNNVSEPQANNT